MTGHYVQQLLLSTLLLGSFLAMSTVRADCVAGGGSQDLGAEPSNRVATTSLDYTFSSDFSCSGFVQLLDYNRIDATLVAADFALTDNTTGESLPYALYTDEARVEPFVLGQTREFGSTTLLDILNLFSSANGSIPLYLRTSPTNLPVGIYTDVINILWEWNYCSGIGALGICLGRDSGTTNILIELQLEVVGNCVVQANDVHLGAVSFLTEAVEADMPVDVNCTRLMSYQIYVDGGDHFDGAQRNMAKGEDTIAYQIRSADKTTAIGPTLLNSQSVTGLGTTDRVNFRVSTLPTPVLPPPGVYFDNVRVIIEY